MKITATEDALTLDFQHLVFQHIHQVKNNNCKDANITVDGVSCQQIFKYYHRFD